MNAEDPVVNAAREAFSLRIADSDNVSDHTRNAQAIAKAWRGKVYAMDPDRFQIEALVAPDLDQRIDVLDPATTTAYELKVSGKQAHSEFYKDVVKLIVWNEKRKLKLTRFVFITEASWGQKYLESPMVRAYRAHLEAHGLTTIITYLDRA